MEFKFNNTTVTADEIRNLTDEELKKFYPSLEVDQLEEAVNRAELIDAVDIYVRMGKDAASVQAAAAQPVRDMRPGRRY